MLVIVHCLLVFVACEKELRNNYTELNTLPIVCPNNVCLVHVSDYSRNRYECNGVTECGDCSDECHCSPNSGVNLGSCRARNAGITLCGEEIRAIIIIQ